MEQLPQLICPYCGHAKPAGACPFCGDRVAAEPGGRAIRPGPGFFLFDLAHGFVTFFAGGLMLFNRPEFAGKLKLPVLVNALVLLVLGATLGLGFYHLFEAALAASWGWLDFLRTPLGWIAPVFVLALTLMCMWFLTPVLIEAVTGPFLEPLADTVEKMLAGPGMVPVHMHLWRNIYASVRSSAQILLLQVAILVPCLLLSFLVGIGVVIGVLAAAFLNAVIWFEIPAFRRGQGLRQRVALLRRNWARALGFGLAYQVGSLVPLFNVLLLAPAAAVSASVLYFHFDKQVLQR